MLEIRRTESRPDRDDARPPLKRRRPPRSAPSTDAPADPPGPAAPGAQSEPRRLDVIA